MATLEDALLAVYLRSLVEDKKTVPLEDQSFPVRSTAKRKFKQIDFQFDGRPATSRTKPRYEISLGKIRDRKETMQFFERGKYVAVVVDGKEHLYPRMKQPTGELLNCCNIFHKPKYSP